jgi:hypothetical protein
MIQVRGQQYQQLVEALVDAFPNLSRFQQMLQFRLGKHLPAIVALPNPMTQIAFDLIGVSNAEGWTADLIAAARESAPGNPRLLGLSESVSLTSATADLERKVRDELAFIDVMAWRARLGELETQVCRVETPTSMGTGFLVGADVVLTNYHVMQSVIQRPALARDVIFRFDYKRLDDGRTLNIGTEHRLVNGDWLLDHSSYSRVDLLDNVAGETPSPDELDYAFLRLDVEAGNEAIAGAKAEPGAGTRGWVKLEKAPPTLVIGAALFILQHPNNQPLKLAIDTNAVQQINLNGTRVRYRTNTEPGSSGSPVFDQHWRLYALHHSGDRAIVPALNQGIPLTAIIALLDQRGKAELLTLRRDTPEAQSGSAGIASTVK